jgi:tRNA nucleotidyltransferase (CCA-adding enzyme)
MDIETEVLSRIRPTKSDLKRVKKVASKLIQKTKEAARKLKVDASPMLVGSVARGTWLNSERDIDIFILFPEELKREELERQGLAVARKVAGKSGTERYAEHPYVTMKYMGFDVDLVPCFKVSDPKAIKSAVDRTPFHQKYVESRLTPELIDQVLLLKQFAYGTGIYGAELKTQGFSGYLCELLIIHYGSFQKIVEEASRWISGKVIDMERAYATESEPRLLFQWQPLIVIDPVDPNRNVAAAVSMQNFATFVYACQDYLRRPSLNFFFPRPARLLTYSEVEELIRRRGTAMFCIAFNPPDLVQDVLYPQLRKTERTMVTRLAQYGFEVIRSDVWADSKAAILIELASSKLPNVRTRLGPPLKMEAGNFISEHVKSAARIAGPFVDAAGRMAFELERSQTSARDVLKCILNERIAFGKNVAEAIAKKYEILDGKKLKRLRDRKFKEFLSDYLTRCLPWYR